MITKPVLDKQQTAEVVAAAETSCKAAVKRRHGSAGSPETAARARQGRKKRQGVLSTRGCRSVEDQRGVFVDAYISNGFNATQAALTAGYSARTASQTAYSLLNTPQVDQAIRQRIAEIRQQAGYGRLSALDEYETNRQAALESGQVSAANKAVDGKCKLLALYPRERAETAHVAMLSEAQRRKLLTAADEGDDVSAVGDSADADAIYDG